MLDLHYKCAGLSVKEYRDICLTSSSWICTKCLLDVLPNSLDDTFSSQTNSISFTNVVTETVYHGFSCLLTNIRSIKNKQQAFHTLISHTFTRIDIIALTETWLDCTVLDHEILPRGYSVFIEDRPYRTGGGVLLACRDDLVCTRRSDLEVNGCELIWCETSSTSRSKFLFGVF